MSAQFRMSSEENRRWLPSRDPYTRSYDHGNIEDPPVYPAVSTRQGCLSVSVSVQRLAGTPLDNDHRLRSVSLQSSLPLSVPNDALTMTWPMPAAGPPHTRLSPVP